ncbi:cation:proton antiporter [Methanoplanus sp. FWC-SCC4]|uniref:Cation:proton antiporter n=1 Tax=Methanochimaera problematica TaxID=2609417 RepID=A0AA97I3K9_9EURY|nr:cation:proton antiporter [Methanoplanus sp. FWC-SCC4]WOF16828.1 cation:proton antiporter [Methanoplanus sp. FWC-SCC4]
MTPVPLESIEFQLALMLLIAVGGYLVAAYIHQSAVVGEIILGLIVGPSFLGLITYTDFVSALAHMGAIIMLFVIGFDFHFKDLLRFPYFIIGACGVILPWILGFLAAELFGYPVEGSFFIGAALTATSIAITANALKEMGKLHTNIANAIIGTAVIDDILALVVLSVTIDIVSGSAETFDIILSIIRPVFFIVIAALTGLYVVDKIIVKLDSSEIAFKFPEFVFLFGLCIAFIYALAADFFGISPMIGAFIAGVSINKVSLRNSLSIKKGSEYLYIPFASIFFISLGVLVDLHEVTKAIVPFIIVLTIIAALSKFIGCSIPAKLLGMDRHDSLVVGAGMIPRGEMAMIIALIGLSMGIMGQDAFISIIMASLICTIMTPLLLKDWLFREKHEYPK